MEKTKAMRDVEARLGRPLDQAFRDAYERHGTMEGVAQELQINLHTAISWRIRLGLTLARVLR